MSSMSGGQGRNRTADASLFRAALYQLSYLATLLGLAFARTVYALARDAILLRSHGRRATVRMYQCSRNNRIISAPRTSLNRNTAPSNIVCARTQRVTADTR